MAWKDENRVRLKERSRRKKGLKNLVLLEAQEHEEAV